MHSMALRTLAVCVALLSPCRPLGGQGLATGAGIPSCARCSIVRIPVATLGSRTDSVLLGPGSILARDSRGRFYASSATRNGAQIAIFDSVGRQVSSFGKTGQGPGELRGVDALQIGGGDTLYVRFHNTVDVFAPVGRFVRRMTLAGVNGLSDVMPLAGQGLLISARFVGPDLPTGFRNTFQIMDEAGNPAGGFGAEDVRCAKCFSKIFAPSRNRSSVLAVGRYTYQVEERDLATGRLVRQLMVRPPWFIENADPGSVTGLARRPSRIMGIAPDTAGLVWITAIAAASDWKPYAGTPPVTRNGAVFSSMVENDTAFVNHMQRSLAMIVEAVDLSGGKVVSSMRTNGDSFVLMDDGTAYDWVEDADGYVRLLVWRFALRAS